MEEKKEKKRKASKIDDTKDHCNANPNKKKKIQCIICLENIEKDPMWAQCCGCTFHKECMEEWENYATTHIVKCPNCRHEYIGQVGMMCEEAIHAVTQNSVEDFLDGLKKGGKDFKEDANFASSLTSLSFLVDNEDENFQMDPLGTEIQLTEEEMLQFLIPSTTRVYV